MAKVEMIKIMSCPRLDEQEISIEKCRACKFHLSVNQKHAKIICGYP